MSKISLRSSEIEIQAAPMKYSSQDRKRMRERSDYSRRLEIIDQEI